MELDFKKGSRDDLVGDVYCYAEFCKEYEIQAPSLIVSYGTYDKKALTRKARELKVPQEKLNFSLEKARFLEQVMNTEWYSLPVHDIKTELDILNGEEDVIFAGRWSTPDMVAFAIGSAMSEYHDLVRSLRKTGQIKQRKMPANYTKFLGQEAALENHLNTKYVNQMIFAKLQKDKDLYEDLRSALIDFGGGASYSVQISELCNRLDKINPAKIETKTIDLLVELIVAINVEKHEKAAQIRDQIRGLI